MPSKENCKATQIFEGDHELFNFNEEVEPMLNVLCSKTLEQARMEVLEETELQIMQNQQKEYEEIVNAELIIAQRYEAAEQRCKEEIDRRKVQNKARKEEKKAAHQKINARQFTKNYLTGLREQAMSQLSAIGVLVPTKSRAIHEEVLPWLMSKITDYLEEEQATVEGTHTVFTEGILDCQNSHASVIRAKYARIQKAEQDRLEAIKQNELRKKRRREAREKRAKDQALEKFKDEVDNFVVMKSETVNCLSTNLLDINGNYQTGPYLGAPGGQLMQMYLIFEDILNRYPQGLKNYMEKKIQNDDEDYFTKPNNLRELLLPEHLMPFLMHYLKDMKNEYIEIVLHEDCKEFLNGLNVPYDDLSGMSDDDLLRFKELFNANRMSEFHLGTGKMMDTLYDYLIDILAKRVPVEGVNVKVDQIMPRIRLTPVPDNIFLQDQIVKEKVVNEDGVEVEHEVEKKRNDKTHALIVLSVPQVEEEQEITFEVTNEASEMPKTEGGAEDEEGAEKPKPKSKTVHVLVDIDQQEKAIMLNPRNVPSLEGKSFLYVNKYAQKAFREDILDTISKTYP
jgi:hypothetical protein